MYVSFYVMLCDVKSSHHALITHFLSHEFALPLNPLEDFYTKYRPLQYTSLQ